MRKFVRRFYLSLMDWYFGFFRREVTPATAVVFAPHPDDETIGCGGTIIKKAELGAVVSVVYLTDGGKSHSETGRFTPAQMAALRRDEAIRACSVLGVPAPAVHFLELPDGSLGEHEELARERVAKILRSLRPSEVFLPYSGDQHADHEAANRIVRAAVASGQDPPVLYEYTTWFWACWPLVDTRGTGLRGIVRAAMEFVHRTTLLLLGFRHAIRISDVCSRKKRALNAHASQTTRLGGAGWFILSDVSDGEWLETFFRRYEVFHRHKCGRR